jgi:hypothetical protein
MSTKSGDFGSRLRPTPRVVSAVLILRQLHLQFPFSVNETLPCIKGPHARSARAASQLRVIDITSLRYSRVPESQNLQNSERGSLPKIVCRQSLSGKHD